MSAAGPPQSARMIEARGDAPIDAAAAARATRAAAWRFVLQRASAAVLAVCVVVHLASIIVAIRGGLSAEAIVARMHANPAWPAFYAVFVVAVAIHAPLGLRAITEEWLGLRGKATDIALGLVALLLLAGGLYAVASLAA